MSLSDRLLITELAQSQSNRSVTVNEAIAKLEAGASLFTAVSLGDNTPPVSPVARDGDQYVLGTAPTGAWSGHGREIAIFHNDAWFFLPPLYGMIAYAQDEEAYYYFDGSSSPGTWTTLSLGGGVSDGDKGDITVSSSGTVWTVDNSAITYAKTQNVSATDRVLGRSTAGAGVIEEITFTSQARQLADDTSFSNMRTTLGLAIGSDVQAYDANTLKSNVSANLTVGYTASGYSAGTKSSGTYTPDPANGALQYATNGGAHTLAPPSTGGGNAVSMVVQYTNNGSAGAITTSGFTKVSGSFTTTNGDDFMCYITLVNGFSHLNIVALQ